MNLNAETEAYLQTLYKVNSNTSDLEYEIVFGTDRFLQDNTITYSKFTGLLRQLKDDGKDKWKSMSQETTLDIQIHKTNEVEKPDYFNLRFTITNPTDISSFCQTNNLSSIDYNVLYKKSNKFTSTEADIIDSLTAKDYTKFKQGTNTSLDIQDYNIKYNLKTELEYNKQARRFIGNNIELVEEANLEYRKYSDYLTQKNNSFENLFKTFRLKNRFSFISEDNIRIDLTIIQQSKQAIDARGRFIQIPTTGFIDSDLLNEDKTYEVEMELFPDKSREVPLYNDIKPVLESNILYIIRSMENYPHIICNTEKTIIQKIYTTLVQKNYYDIITRKSNVLDLLLENNKDQAYALDKTYCENIVNQDLVKLKVDVNRLKDAIKNNKYPYSNKSVYNISPKPVSLDITNIQSGTKTSILDIPFSVTDKADGLAKQLYIVGLDHLMGEDNPYKVSSDELDNYKNYNGKIYMIDSNLVIYPTGLRIKESEIYRFNNTLLNGEYLNKNILEQDIQLYKAYDLYFNNGIDTKKLPLISEEPKDTRIMQLNKLIDDLSNNIEIVNVNSLSGIDYSEGVESSAVLKIESKKFEIGLGEQIFSKSKKIWDKYKNHSSSYKFDGLIFTPCDNPVGYSSSPDFDINISATWKQNLKWKPPHENTIDFLIKEEKETSISYDNREYKVPKISIISDNSSDRTYIQYKTFTLQVGRNEKEKQNPCNINQTYNKKTNKRYLPTDFVPTHPYNKKAYISKLTIDGQKKEVFGNEWVYHKSPEIITDGEQTISIEGGWITTGDIIKDDTIVEFSYQNYDEKDHRHVKNEAFRWLPVRTRHDKTFKYRKGVKTQKSLFAILQKFLSYIEDEPGKELNGIEESLLRKLNKVIHNVPNIKVEAGLYKTLKTNSDIIRKYYPEPHFITQGVFINYGNDFATANHNWKLIHNPITEVMITTGIGITDEIDTEEKYYNRDLSQCREKSLTITMQNFHNRVVKNKVLLTNICRSLRDQDTVISLLDLATGKGGDISKWFDNRIDNIVGIDINYNNINDENDGACARLKSMQDNRRYRSDMSDYISQSNVQFMVGDVSRNILDGSAFNEQYSRGQWLQLWKEETHNFSVNKFNIISIMFGIHYMFKNKSDLDNFIDNIDQNLSDGGYFIGACMDGKRLFDYFEREGIEKNGYLVGYNKSSITWKIQKKYGTGIFKNDDTSLGLPIGVYISSINQEIIEYLVNFEYLISRLKERNIELLSNTHAQELNLPMDGNGEHSSYGSFELIYDQLNSTLKEKLAPIESKLYRNIITNMTPDEKKISFLNNYFVFQKKTDIDININEIYSLISTNVSQNVKWDKALRKGDVKFTILKDLVEEELNKIMTVSLWDKVISKISDSLLKTVSKHHNKTKHGGEYSNIETIDMSNIVVEDTESDIKNKLTVSDLTVKITQMQHFYVRIMDKFNKPGYINDASKIKPLLDKYLKKFNNFKEIQDIYNNFNVSPLEMWKNIDQKLDDLNKYT